MVANKLIYINRNRHWRESIFVVDLLIHIIILSFLLLEWSGRTILVIPVIIYVVLMWLYLYKKYFTQFKIYHDRIEIGGGALNRTVETFKYVDIYKCVFSDKQIKRITLFGGVNFAYVELFMNDSFSSEYVKNGVMKLRFTEYDRRYEKIKLVLKHFKSADVKLIVNSSRTKFKELRQ